MVGDNFSLGIYHKSTGNLIAFPFDDSEEGLEEVIDYLENPLHIPLDDVLVDEYQPGVTNYGDLK